METRVELKPHATGKSLYDNRTLYVNARGASEAQVREIIDRAVKYCIHKMYIVEIPGHEHYRLYKAPLDKTRADAPQNYIIFVNPGSTNLYYVLAGRSPSGITNRRIEQYLSPWQPLDLDPEDVERAVQDSIKANVKKEWGDEKGEIFEQKAQIEREKIEAFAQALRLRELTFEINVPVKEYNDPVLHYLPRKEDRVPEQNKDEVATTKVTKVKTDYKGKPKKDSKGNVIYEETLIPYKGHIIIEPVRLQPLDPTKKRSSRLLVSKNDIVDDLFAEHHPDIKKRILEEKREAMLRKHREEGLPDLLDAAETARIEIEAHNEAIDVMELEVKNSIYEAFRFFSSSKDFPRVTVCPGGKSFVRFDKEDAYFAFYVIGRVVPIMGRTFDFIYASEEQGLKPDDRLCASIRNWRDESTAPSRRKENWRAPSRPVVDEEGFSSRGGRRGRGRDDRSSRPTTRGYSPSYGGSRGWAPPTPKAEPIYDKIYDEPPRERESDEGEWVTAGRKPRGAPASSGRPATFGRGRGRGGRGGSRY